MCTHFPLGLAGEGSMGSGCSRSLEHSLTHTTKAMVLVDVLFHHETCILADAGLKWQHLCQEMGTDREQAMPRRQCLITYVPQEAIFSGWRNWFLFLQSMHTAEWHVGQGGVIIWKWFYVWELLKIYLCTLGGGRERVLSILPKLSSAVKDGLLHHGFGGVCFFSSFGTHAWMSQRKRSNAFLACW